MRPASGLCFIDGGASGARLVELSFTDKRRHRCIRGRLRLRCPTRVLRTEHQVTPTYVVASGALLLLLELASLWAKRKGWVGPRGALVAYPSGLFVGALAFGLGVGWAVLGWAVVSYAAGLDRGQWRTDPRKRARVESIVLATSTVGVATIWLLALGGRVGWEYRQFLGLVLVPVGAVLGLATGLCWPARQKR